MLHVCLQQISQPCGTRTCEACDCAGRDLVNMAKKRPNIIPIIEDARHPVRYRMLVPMVDVVFADVAQPDQVRRPSQGGTFSDSQCHAYMCWTTLFLVSSMSFAQTASCAPAGELERVIETLQICSCSARHRSLPYGLPTVQQLLQRGLKQCIGPQQSCSDCLLVQISTMMLTTASSSRGKEEAHTIFQHSFVFVLLYCIAFCCFILFVSSCRHALSVSMHNSS